MKKLTINTQQVATYEREYDVVLTDEMYELIKQKTIEGHWELQDVFDFLQLEGLVHINDCSEDYNEEDESVYDQGRYILSASNKELEDWLEEIKDAAAVEPELV
jgi:vacuolar-type H+-ATPase subunit I/STV1